MASRPSRRPGALCTAPFLTALSVQGFSRRPHLLLTFLRLWKLRSTSSASSALLVALGAPNKPPGRASHFLPAPRVLSLSLSPARQSSAADFAASRPASDIPPHSSASSQPAFLDPQSAPPGHAAFRARAGARCPAGRARRSGSPARGTLSEPTVLWLRPGGRLGRRLRIPKRLPTPSP